MRLEYFTYDPQHVGLSHSLWLPYENDGSGWEARAILRDEMIDWCREQFGIEENNVWAVHGSSFLFARPEDAFALQMRFG